ncbi:SMP-30/gluconolactonase/LRE family protein [Methylobacter tundripaludum]|uniref:SMP-30/Gluconolaconase/LRE-like region-containing protein n=1 Tax=Methylobacter tundripaludum (strain ATCC BAA-1195 / DSM 17260 / SV96) TaxID=697282 RepID=G3IXJ2_METTV|nr:SMP-30/gluconolactonase/LRE family protein [Methylobacter tundripaludum]EGW23401.1 SMP-30/Gluconolaconase/LRE-like region-containing protein [Methylobacter tundripaludum SV96]
MLLKTSHAKLFSVLGALVFAVSVQADDPVTPAIPGVSAGGVIIELIKDGFKGTEGPIGYSDGSLLFTETNENRIVRIAPDNTVSTFLENSNGANGLALNAGGEIIAVQTLKPQVGIVYPADKQKVFAENFEGVAFQRPNDVVLHKSGGIYFTDSGTRPTKENPNPPASHPGVFYISPTGELKRLANDVDRPNGIQLNKDETVLYVANTLGEHVLAYDIAADGSISNRRNFAKLDGWKNEENVWSSGADGLAIDDNDRLYVASNSGIEVFDAKGEALGVIALPKKPQNIAFAGTDKKTLYAVGRGSAYRIPLLAQGFKGRAK